MTSLLFLPVEDIKTNIFVGFNESKNRDKNDRPVTLTLQGKGNSCVVFFNIAGSSSVFLTVVPESRDKH